MYRRHVMKKLIPLLLITLSASVMAQHHHHGNYSRNWQSNPNWWIAPVVIGGVIGYELNRQQQVIIQQPPIVVQQPPIIYTPQPQPMIQQPPLGYHWQEMIDPVTSQRKIVLVPN